MLLSLGAIEKNCWEYGHQYDTEQHKDSNPKCSVGSSLAIDTDLTFETVIFDFRVLLRKMVLADLALTSLTAANAVITLGNCRLTYTATILAWDTPEPPLISLNCSQRRNLGLSIPLVQV